MLYQSKKKEIFTKALRVRKNIGNKVASQYHIQPHGRSSATTAVMLHRRVVRSMRKEVRSLREVIHIPRFVDEQGSAS